MIFTRKIIYNLDQGPSGFSDKNWLYKSADDYIKRFLEGSDFTSLTSIVSNNMRLPLHTRTKEKGPVYIFDYSFLQFEPREHWSKLLYPSGLSDWSEALPRVECRVLNPDTQRSEKGEWEGHNYVKALVRRGLDGDRSYKLSIRCRRLK